MSRYVSPQWQLPRLSSPTRLVASNRVCRGNGIFLAWNTTTVFRIPHKLASQTREPWAMRCGLLGIPPLLEGAHVDIRAANLQGRAKSSTGRLLPLLRHTLDAYLCRSWHVPALRALSARGPARRDGAVLSAPCLRLRKLLSGSAPGIRQPGHIFSDYAYFSSYSTSWVEHAKTYCTKFAIGWGSTPTASSSNSPATTAICSSISSRAGIPVLGIEPAANVAESRSRRGFRRWSLLRAGTASELVAEAASRPDRR